MQYQPKNVKVGTYFFRINLAEFLLRLLMEHVTFYALPLKMLCKCRTCE